jgi:hypothetical protein
MAGFEVIIYGRFWVIAEGCLGTVCRYPQIYDKWAKIDAQRQSWSEYARHLDGTTSRTRYRPQAACLLTDLFYHARKGERDHGLQDTPCGNRRSIGTVSRS